ncbi:hypothetical protein IEQ34_012739 [Dendrobium chrysotoxum]|uniref:RNase H type-1 domain-containing protein n=1 Tax=Dendrobium chrysotoxum TaxID=161865 RepID=A0AAV7G6I0_DENCH|nr:hypothetical protein IEQ34_012739 [Dendrobium chrysotoxum]
MAGIGGVIRDDRGRFLLAFGVHYRHWDIAQVELMAVYSLKNFMQEWMCESQGVMIEGDNINVIKILQGALKEWKNKGRIDQNLSFLQDFNQALFSFCNRGCNKLADVCANLGVKSSFIWSDLNDVEIPPSFLSCLKEECDALGSF